MEKLNNKNSGFYSLILKNLISYLFVFQKRKRKKNVSN